MSHLLKKLNFNYKNKPKILVIGDVILDKYITGKIRGISSEAPVPIIDVEEEYYRLGGCSNVAANIKSLMPEISVDVCGMLGSDFGGVEIRKMLDKLKISHEHVMFTDKHPTILKTRVVGDNRQIVRFDVEHKSNVDPKDHAKLLTKLNKISSFYDVIIVSDYNKGVICDKIVTTLKISAEKSTIIVDPKKKDFMAYRGADIITPNIKEFEIALDNKVEDVENAKTLSCSMINKFAIKNVVLTMSENGILLTNEKLSEHYPAMPREVVDVCGAGDIVVAAIASFLASKMDLQDSVYLANVAAGVSVSKFGTCTVTLDEVREHLKNALHKESI